MTNVNVIARWSECGQGPAEQMIAEQMKPGEIQEIIGRDLIKLLELKNKGKSEKLILKQEIEENKNYQIYYNFHSSSGYKTEIKKSSDSYSIEIIPPSGGVLCAFFSEVIIFD